MTPAKLADELEKHDVEFDADFYTLGELVLDNLPTILAALRRVYQGASVLKDLARATLTTIRETKP